MNPFRTILSRIFIISAITLCVTATTSFAQNTKAQENQKARLERDIALLNKQLKGNQSKSKDAMYELSLIRKKINSRKELVAESDRAIASISKSLKAKKAEVEALQSRMDTLTRYYEKLVLSAYKNRDSKVWYMYILSSDNLGQAFRRMGYLKNMSSQINLQGKKVMETRSQLEEERENLEKMKAEAQALRNQRANEVSALQSEERQSEDIVRRLNKEKSKYQKQINDKRRQVDELNREIARIIRESARSSSGKKGSATKKSQIDYALDSEFAKNKGKLPWPADGPVVESYGQHYHPVFKNVKLPFNNGVSIALPEGCAVKAIFDGVVKQIVVIPGYNKCILVQHGNYFSLYGKIGSVSVKAGDKVKTGQNIGTVDTIDGTTTLHLQIWKGTTPQNPELWLRS